MKNKTLALNKIEKLKNGIKNVHTAVYRNDRDQYEEWMEKVNLIIEDLENTISIEQEEYLTRPYGSL